VIVLDTHAWVWWVTKPDALSPEARRAVEGAVQADGIYVSSISVWELAMLVAKGRLELKLDVHDWVAGCESLPFFTFVPVDNNIALRSINLPGYDHSDPADRIIIATAITMGNTLVTQDRRIRGYQQVKTVW
jgi:PIN domain nuclease of toxin-antitoxin system